MMILGSSVWAYVLSSGCGIIATLNPNGVHYRHVMDELNYFAKEKRLPKVMTIKLREFFTQTQHVNRESRFDVLLDQMSARLKADAALCWAKATLMKVPYFAIDSLEDNFLASTALCLSTRVFCRSEYLQVDDLQIVARGIAAKHGRIFTKGSCLGEDMVLADTIFRDLTPAVALTFVLQVSAMEKKHLEALLAEYPVARRKIRAATYRLAFCRAMVALARIFTREEGNGKGEVSMTRALEIIRAEKVKAVTRLVEPTKRVLMNSLHSLSERVDAIGDEQVALGETMQAGVQSQITTLRGEVGSLSAKLDALLAMHGANPNAIAANAAAAAARPEGYLPAGSAAGAMIMAPGGLPAAPLQRSRTAGRLGGRRSGEGGERPPPRRKQRATQGELVHPTDSPATGGANGSAGSAREHLEA